MCRNNVAHPSHKYFSELGLQYGIFGPWPVPSPVAAQSLPPTAIHLPKEEIGEFRKFIVSRYIKSVKSKWTDALLYALKNRGLAPVSDEEFVHLFVDSPFARFLNPTLDPDDITRFQKFLQTGSFFKVDFSAMANLPLIDDVYCAQTVSLFEKKSDGHLQIVTILIDDLLLEPEDGHAFTQAKYFVLQGAANHLIGCDHPRLHFPMNAINSITKSVIPKAHILFKLLKPHLWLQLGLDFAVLHHKKSVGHNHEHEIYTPFPWKMAGFYTLLSAGYKGIAGNSSYPKYEYPLQCPTIHSDYGTFLKHYYTCIHGFVAKVLSEVSPKDPHILGWANHISQLVPGFPGGSQISENHLLVNAVTTFIFNVSVFHSSDHHAYVGRGSINQVPLRLRFPPPSSKDAGPIDMKNAIYRQDVFRQHMATEMFFRDFPITKLAQVDYEFESEALIRLNAEFHDALKKTEAELTVRPYIPLDQIACSIQY